jgi:hypothetical protein
MKSIYLRIILAPVAEPETLRQKARSAVEMLSAMSGEYVTAAGQRIRL